MGKTGREKLFFYAAAAAAGAAAAWTFWAKSPPAVQNLSYYADRGGLLFHALADKAAGYSMPLTSLAAYAAERLGFSLLTLARLTGLLLCLPAYAIGARGGGRARGALFALAAALAGLTCAGQEAEQLLYSFLLLLFLDLELRRQATGGAGLAALSGLAAGFTLLVRSPLFAFPPLAALFQYFSLRPGFRKWLAATAVFLACAWLVVLPWARLTNSLFGKPVFFEEGRPACNVITGASGIVYTIEGDARAFAGLSQTESVYPWAVRTVLAHPGRYALAVGKRVIELPRMFPLLFLLAGLGLLLARRRGEARFLAFFSAYFILIHCLLSIEERYFQPLRYALALLAAAGAWELLRKALPAPKPGRDHFTAPLFALAAAAAALTLAVVWRYPGDAAPPLIAVERELAEEPRNPWLHLKKGEALLALDLTAQGLESLARACALGAGDPACYASRVMRAAAPEAPPPGAHGYEMLLIKLARELELGSESAAATLAGARSGWESEKNSIKGPPREEDAPTLLRLKETNLTFWDSDLAGALAYLEPARRPAALKRLARLAPLTPGLKELAAGRAVKERGHDAALAYVEALLLSPHLAVPPPAGLPPLAAALAAALKAAGERGRLPALLMTAAPSPGQAALLYLASRDAGTLAAAAGRSQENLLFPLARFMALKGGGTAGLESALRAAPSFLLAAAGEAAAADRDSAALLLKAALASRRAGPEITRQGALLYQELGEHERSAEIISGLLKKNPGDPALNNDLGVALLFLGREREAEAAFLSAAAADPGAPSPALNLAAIYSRRGDREKAAAFYGAALASPRLPPGEKERLKRNPY